MQLNINMVKASPFLFTTVIALMAIPALSPWQLFQSMCPYFSAQSPQCAMLLRQQQLQTQQQLPSQQQQLPILPQPQQQQLLPYQQQQQLCPDGSQPDATGNCPITQQQQQIPQYQQAPPLSSTTGIP
jgi:hypothetical protein